MWHRKGQVGGPKVSALFLSMWLWLGQWTLLCTHLRDGAIQVARVEGSGLALMWYAGS